MKYKFKNIFVTELSCNKYNKNKIYENIVIKQHFIK